MPRRNVWVDQGRQVQWLTQTTGCPAQSRNLEVHASTYEQPVQTVQEGGGMRIPSTNVTNYSSHIVLDPLQLVEVLLRHAVQQ